MKKLLLTGYPGFLASAIKEWFEKNDWQVDTLGILPFPDGESQSGSHIICNIAESVPDLPDVTYDMVIHAAGKAHVVPKTEAEKQAFYDINVKGTEHVLSALQKHPPCSLVFISSVAVYGVETGENIAETAPLLAKTPYGESKILAEKLITDTAFSKDVIRGIVRLPLIAGPKAPGNLGSMFQAMRKGFFFNIGKGEARRSVILRSDVPPALYLVATHGGIYNITDGNDLSFAELADGIHKIAPYKRRPALPRFIACLLATAGEILQMIFRRSMPFNFKRYHQMTECLTFDGRKAQNELKFSPHPVLENLQELVKE